MKGKIIFKKPTKDEGYDEACPLALAGEFRRHRINTKSMALRYGKSENKLFI